MKIPVSLELAAPQGDGQAIFADMLESKAEPRDLTVQQIPQVRDLFEDESGYGLYLFTYYICGCKDIKPDPHLEMCQFLSMWGKLELSDGTVVNRPEYGDDDISQNWRRLHVCVPRDTFKTSVATRANTLWHLLKNPEFTVGIFNESEAKAKSWVGSIKQVIERSQLLHTLWPERLPPGVHYKSKKTIPRNWKWGDSGIVLERDSLNVSELSVEPFGIGGAVTGKHFTHKVLDDIIGEKSVQSQAIMDDAIHWLDNSRPLERPAEGGCELVVYTRWAYHDVYRHQLQKWPGQYKVYHRALLENPETREPDVVNGKSIVPHKISTKKAKEMYRRDPFVFNSQYQCTPQSGKDVSFNVEWIRYGGIEMLAMGTESQPYFVIEPEYYDPEACIAEMAEESVPPRMVPLSWCAKAVILDPAPSSGSAELNKERRARNGIVVMALDPWGRRFHLESAGIRDEPTVVLDKIVEFTNKWETDLVGIEEVNFSAIYAPMWTAMMPYTHPDAQRLQFFPLATEGKQKEARISAMKNPHSQGLWFYNRPESGYTVQELSEFPNSETRDLIDAMAYTDKILSRPLSPDEQIMEMWRGTSTRSGRCEITGY